MKKCPYCAEQIQDDAIKCRYCNEWLNKEILSSSEKNAINKSENNYIKELEIKYKQMSIDELCAFKKSYNPNEYTLKAQRIINDVFMQRTKELNEIENDIEKLTPFETKEIDKEHGTFWKIYFIFFILSWLLGLYFWTTIIELVAGAIYLFISSNILYSWIWAKRISWLSRFRWLVKLWSFQFFIAPIALVVHLYLFFVEKVVESLSWIINIVVLFPSLYIFYRIAWKSRLLYATKDEKPNK